MQYMPKILSLLYINKYAISTIIKLRRALFGNRMALYTTFASEIDSLGVYSIISRAFGRLN
jgi:hypothetical protein